MVILELWCFGLYWYLAVWRNVCTTLCVVWTSIELRINVASVVLVTKKLHECLFVLLAYPPLGALTRPVGSVAIWTLPQTKECGSRPLGDFCVWSFIPLAFPIVHNSKHQYLRRILRTISNHYTHMSWIPPKRVERHQPEEASRLLSEDNTKALQWQTSGFQ